MNLNILFYVYGLMSKVLCLLPSSGFKPLAG
jgi:hypothetical protein